MVARCQMGGDARQHYVVQTGRSRARGVDKWGSPNCSPLGDGGGHWGIGLLEIVWKLITSIVDAMMKAKVEFHDVLHGFQAERGTGTAIIEAKLLQQLGTAVRSLF